MKKRVVFLAAFACILCILTAVAAANRGTIGSMFQLARERSKIKDNTGNVVATVGNEKIYESAVEKWALGYEERQQRVDAAVEAAENEEQRAFLAEQFGQTDPEQREEIIDRLIRQKKLYQFCEDRGIVVTDQEADAYRMEMEALVAEQAAKGNEQALEMQKAMQEQQEGSGLSEEEYQRQQREGYREQLLNIKLYQHYQQQNTALPFETWWEQESAYIKVVLR